MANYNAQTPYSATDEAGLLSGTGAGGGTEGNAGGAPTLGSTSGAEGAGGEGEEVVENSLPTTRMPTPRPM